MTANTDDAWSGPHPVYPRGAGRRDMMPPMLDPAYAAHIEAQRAATDEKMRTYIEETLEKRVSRIAVFGETAAAVTRAAAIASGITIDTGVSVTVEPGFPDIVNPERAHTFAGMAPGRGVLASDFVHAAQGSEPDRWTLTVPAGDGRGEAPTVHEFTDPNLVRALTAAHYADTQYAQLADLQGIDDPDVVAAVANAASTHGPIAGPLAQWATLAAARQVIVFALHQALEVTHGALTQNADLQQVRTDLVSERKRIDNALADLEPALNTVLEASRSAFWRVDNAVAAYRDRAERTVADVEQDAIENARAALATVRPVTVNLPARKEADAPEKATGKKEKKGKKTAEGPGRD